MTEFKTTSRGFKIYSDEEIIDSHDNAVRVQESSAAGDSCAWIFTSSAHQEHPSPHLTVKNAKILIEHLQAFIDDSEDPENWHNDPKYIETYRDPDNVVIKRKCPDCKGKGKIPKGKYIQGQSYGPEFECTGYYDCAKCKGKGKLDVSKI